MSDSAQQGRLPPERGPNTPGRCSAKQGYVLRITISTIMSSFIDLGIIIRSLLAAGSIAATRTRQGLLSQYRRAVAEEASFFSSPLGADLLAPHVVVATLLGEELFVGTAFVHRSFV